MRDRPPPLFSLIIICLATPGMLWPVQAVMPCRSETGTEFLIIRNKRHSYSPPHEGFSALKHELIVESNCQVGDNLFVHSFPVFSLSGIDKIRSHRFHFLVIFPMLHRCFSCYQLEMPVEIRNIIITALITDIRDISVGFGPDSPD